jgi:hypothetical protein
VSILAAAPTGSVLQQLNHGTGDVDIPAVLNRIRADLHPGQLAFVDDSNTQILGISAQVMAQVKPVPYALKLSCSQPSTKVSSVPSWNPPDH